MSKNIQTCFKRYEKKYFLTEDQYIAFKKMIAAKVKPDKYSRYTLCNIYFDTDDYRLIRASLEKPVYKEKLRVRSYGTPGKDDKVFTELKKKYEGVVYKRRIVTTEREAAAFLSGSGNPGRDDQISREIDYFRKFYGCTEKVFIAYDREAFQGTENEDLRITFDTNLRYRLDHLSLSEGDYGDPITDDCRILMEIKIPGVCPLWLCEALSSIKIAPVSFSKYGYCYTHHILRKGSEITVKEMMLSA